MPGSTTRHKFFVQTLSMFFGFGSWIAMTGLWVELPLLTQKLPERWSLGSFLTVMIQLANVGPLVYWWVRAKGICGCGRSERSAIHIQMCIGTVSCVMLIGWWDTTAVIFGVERSIVLYLASFGLSIVDCTSSVAFLPYMARFKAHHMTPYLIGEGLSGFLPSLVALAQGVTDEGEAECPEGLGLGSDLPGNITEIISGIPESNPEDFLNSSSELIPNGEGQRLGQEPRFSANVFFCFLLLILLLSWVAFTLMDLLSVCRTERIDLLLPEVELELSKSSPEVVSLTSKSEKNVGPEAEVKVVEDSKNSTNHRRKFYWLLALMAWGCFTTFGFMPSIQSYSSLPYGAETFFYVVTLSGLAYPAACVFGLFVDIRRPLVINALTIVGSVIGLYILVCGTMSPNPPLKFERAGSVVMILCWLTYVGMLSYMKTMVSLELNELGGNQAMFWCGFAQQFGAASGGALIFIVVNFTNVFKEENKCSE